MLPAYSYETNGPPHAHCFKLRVRVDGNTYETKDYLFSLKDAKNAAANVALG